MGFDLVFWHWWVLAAVLLSLEMLTLTTFLLWPALAAIVLGLLIYVAPDISLTWQVFTFAVLSAVLAITLGRLWQRYRSAAEAGSTLNRRAHQYVGRVAVVAVDFAGGSGAISLDDTRWSARTGDATDPRAGSRVEIMDVDGATLIVRPVA